MSATDSFEKSRRYDDAFIQRECVREPTPCAIQPRDIALVNDVRRYKFLTADQIRELWWPDATASAAGRRLLKLHQAGLIDRFRPLSNRGSFPWTYQLAPAGHDLLKSAGAIERRERFTQRAIYDYSYVVHDLQLNSWVLAYRRLLGERLLRWEGETDILPPADCVEAKPLRPDGILKIGGQDGKARTLLLEYDRTGRPDKNYDKFERYETYLSDWWRRSDFAGSDQPLYVLFVCQTLNQRSRLMNAAAAQRPRGGQTSSTFLLFAEEEAIYAGDRIAIRLRGRTAPSVLLPG